MARKPSSGLFLTSVAAGATGSILTMIYMSKKRKSQSIGDQVDQLKSSIAKELDLKKQSASHKFDDMSETVSKVFKK